MNKFIYIFSLFFFLGISIRANAQINRTLKTKVIDILAQMPTENHDHLNKLMDEIIQLDVEGILMFTENLKPLGTGDDTQARYALHSLAVHSATDPAKAATVEKAFLQAIDGADDDEVKTFLIRRLQFFGSNKSIAHLSGFLTNTELYDPALATLTNIGTEEAGQAVLVAFSQAKPEQKLAFIETLGALEYAEADDALIKITAEDNPLNTKKALMVLAKIGTPKAVTTIKNAVEKANYQNGETGAVEAGIYLIKTLADKGNTAVSTDLAEDWLKKFKSPDQSGYRAAVVQQIVANKGQQSLKMLLKETRTADKKYVSAILQNADKLVQPNAVSKWANAYKKAPESVKPLLIDFLKKNDSPIVLSKVIEKAIGSKNETVKQEGYRALAYQDKTKALPLLLNGLSGASTETTQVIGESILKLVGEEDIDFVSGYLPKLNDNGKTVIVNVLAARHASDKLDNILGLLDSGTPQLKSSIYNALPAIANENQLATLLNLVEKTSDSEHLQSLQKAIAKNIGDDGSQQEPVLSAYKNLSDKSKLLPVLAELSTDDALDLVKEQLRSGDKNLQLTAINSLANWKNTKALPVLLEAIKNNTGEVRKAAFENYLKAVVQSGEPEDQKLLLIKKTVPLSRSTAEKTGIIRAAQQVKTFLSLVFVGDYLNHPDLKETASYAVIRIALPTPGNNDGLHGDIVRNLLKESVNNLTGPESQYVKIDVNEYLENMPAGKGFVPIFNGKDLTGWEGLVENPIARSKMSKRKLAALQKKANEQMMRDWFVEDGVIGFKGEGYNNICTIKDYGDFEMFVDWKITNGGDSGIYLRGTPQVQIWDTARTDVGAEVGSGGLYNNLKHPSKPLVVADNPIDEWNTFRIKMIGDKVTVYLNGILVTDNVVLENYWDRSMPIFDEEAIELQAHGEDLGFTNIYVREINPNNEQLTEEEKKEGFTSLITGKDLDLWVGNKTDYVVENGILHVRPKEGGHGNLFTAKEYDNFIFRFEFKLTPGANNGLGIHAPMDGDAAYVGKELQILDNTAEIFANLEPWQYHGSVYGVMAAKRGFLKPLGEWNKQEVIVNGDDIKITLNGEVILDGNMKEASKNGTLDGKDHPGLNRNKGHIGFLGHGSELQFRNIRVKEL